MGLTVTTAAATQDLVAILAVKDELGLTDASADTVLERLIRRVSSDVRAYCGQTFTRESVTETLAGTNGPRLYLSRTPVVTLGTVTIDGQVVTDAVVDNALAGSLYREQGWPAKGRRVQPLSRDLVPGGEALSISVAYLGGYLLPSFRDVTPTLPGAVEDAVLAMVKARWHARAADPNLASERIGDYGYTAAQGDADPRLAVTYASQLAPFLRVETL